MTLQATERRVRVRVLLGLLLTSLPLTALADDVTVRQKDRQFQTKHVEIAPGDVVSFTNEDPFLHQLYTQSPQFEFDSAEQFPGEILKVKFPQAGTYEVRCGIHPKMLLEVDVDPASASQ